MDININILKLSKDLLKQALTKGYIQLPNTTDIRELSTVQILSIAKAVVKDGLTIDDITKQEENINLPDEMFIQNASTSRHTLVDTINEMMSVLKDQDTYYSHNTLTPKDENNKLVFLDKDNE